MQPPHESILGNSISDDPPGGGNRRGGGSDCVLESDLSLVDRVRRQEQGAPEELLDRLRCLARLLSAMNTRWGQPFDSHELADLSQDTLLVVWRKLDRFCGPLGLENWVLQIARFEFRNAVRKKSRRGASVGPLAAEPEPAEPDDPIQRMIRHDQVQRAIDDLDPKVAETVRLKHYGGLTFEEIGERMRCSANTAKTRYYRCLTHLARNLGLEQP